MRKLWVVGFAFTLLALSAFAADDVASAVVGTVKAVDKATKTVVVMSPCLAVLTQLSAAR